MIPDHQRKNHQQVDKFSSETASESISATPPSPIHLFAPPGFQFVYAEWSPPLVG
ncbi:hypothetical protein MtrunA17_Chr5g0397871 [Medicago truncatula]|uniref:Uncharacterized protein n=1 Tax=Medicago truncatula TaxID=3880 RepID=A0A396HK09_MEDTR|nr:hypothetical protein MtrunA17_Chr5g0397871 [Medicago truncatula]